MSLKVVGTNQYRKFGYVVATMIALIFGLFFPLVFGKPFQEWPWIVAAIFTAWAIILPRTLKIIYHPWMYFGHIIGIINTKIILCIVFFFMFIPISLILKSIGKDAMNREIIKSDNSSYWVISQRQQKSDMNRCY